MSAAAYDPNANRDPYAPTAEDRKRAEMYQRACDAYDGKFHGGDPQWPLLWKTGKEPNPNVWINRCGPAVDTDVAWLFGESVTITLGKGAPSAAQDYTDQVWGVSKDDSSDDDKMSLLQELATNGATYGTAYLKILWDEDDADQEYPELCVLDSSMVRVQTEPHNAKIARCYIIEYKVPDPTSKEPGAMGMFRQVTEVHDADNDHDTAGDSDADAYWTITDYFKPARTGIYTQVGAVRTWTHNWAPIIACPHIARPNSFYGRPRITPDVIHVNEAICMVASNINKIGMRHAHPILYTIKTGSNQRALRHEPGTIMEVSSDVKAVEAHGDLEHLMAQEEDLRADFDEETHVPAQAFGRQQDIPKTPVSGVAIRLGYGPLMADITKERRTYGALIRRATKHLLELKNKAWADYDVTLGWQDPLPADDLQQAQVVQAASGLGVISKRTAAEKFGLEWDIEQENMKDEAQDALAAFAHGQRMPSAVPVQPAAPANAASEPGQAPPPANGAAPNGQMPPTNHPAAVRQRAAVKAVSNVMKGAQQ